VSDTGTVLGLREQFEAWFADRVLCQPGERFEQDDVGGYIDPTVHDMWWGYVAGAQARDAEVQALQDKYDQLRQEFTRVASATEEWAEDE